MSVQPKNPVTMTYQSHDSPIYSVSFSPFHRHLFLTSAHDGQIRIYSQLFVSDEQNRSRSHKSCLDVSSPATDGVSRRHKEPFLRAAGLRLVRWFLPLEVNMLAR